MIAVGCGGDETTQESTDQVAEPVVEHEPGAPPEGEPDYAGLGTWWQELPSERRLASALAFAEAHPSECADVDPVDLERQTGIAYGYEFADAAPTSEVMLETCALLRDGA